MLQSLFDPPGRLGEVPLPVVPALAEAEAVVFVSRDEVEMEVGDYLTGERAVRLEEVEPLGPQALFERPGDPLGRAGHSLELLRWELEEVAIVPLRDDQGMAPTYGVDVEEGDRPLVLVDDMSRSLVADDPAEGAVHHQHQVSQARSCSSPLRRLSGPMAVRERGLEKSSSATFWTSSVVTASILAITSSSGIWRS